MTLRQDPTVLEGISLVRAARWAGQNGLDPLAIGQQVGLHASDLTDPTRLQPIRRVCQYFKAIADAAGDPSIGLRFAEVDDPAEFGLMGLLFAQCPTVGEGLRTVNRLYDQLMPGGDFLLSVSEQTVRVELRFNFEHPGIDIFRQEILAALCRNLRRVCADFDPIQAVELRARPLDPVPYQRFFFAPLRFGAPTEVLALDPRVMEVSNPGASPILLHHLQESFEVNLQRRRAAARKSARILHLGEVAVDLETGAVTRFDDLNAAPTHLTSRERALLNYLASRPNETVTHEEIDRDVWHMGKGVVSHAPAVAIRRLRAKIEANPNSPTNLLTVFGAGWKLVVNT
jgi:DNA-binding winged helix-turn-helix (wHTH) protein